MLVLRIIELIYRVIVIVKHSVNEKEYIYIGVEVLFILNLT